MRSETDYRKILKSFEAERDTGFCILDAEGRMTAFLRSGIFRELSRQVTFGIPAHFAIDPIFKHLHNPELTFNQSKPSSQTHPVLAATRAQISGVLVVPAQGSVARVVTHPIKPLSRSVDGTRTYV